MIIGMSISAFTQFHVLLSLIGIIAGLVAVAALCAGKERSGWSALFLVTTFATSATGFLFHSVAFGAPHAVGVLSIVVLSIAAVARYQFELAGRARWIYVLCAVVALYLNCFVGVVQSFQKIPSLHALAPTQTTEPPFVVAQVLLLAVAIATAVCAVRRFRPHSD
jgi:hypothetical protein